MPRDGRILDIRINGLFGPLSYVAAWVGDRMAQELRSRRLELGEADRVYVELSDKPPHDRLELAIAPNAQSRTVTYHLDPDIVRKLPADANDAFVIDLVERAMRTATNDDPETKPVVAAAVVELRKHGRRLAVEHIERETGEYALKVMQCLMPSWERPTDGHGSPKAMGFAVLDVVDKTTDERRWIKLAEFNDYDGLHYLAADIVVKGDTIVVKRRGASKDHIRVKIATLRPFGVEGYFEPSAS